MAHDGYHAGMAVRRDVLGDAHVDHAEAAKTDFDADFQRFITENAWGFLWTRPDLDRRTRSLLVIALLAQQGQEDELAMHLCATRSTGATVAEIREVVFMVAAYAGAGAAERTERIARRVLDEAAKGAAP
jgi:4-carboxymuconolactone decarboxylase